MKYLSLFLTVRTRRVWNLQSLSAVSQQRSFPPFVRFISSDGGLSYCTLSEQIKSSDPRVLFFNLPCIFFYVKKPVETKNSVNIGVTYLVYLDATCLTRYHIQSQS